MNRMTQISRMTQILFFIDFHRVSLMFILSFYLNKDARRNKEKICPSVLLSKKNFFEFQRFQRENNSQLATFNYQLPCASAMQILKLCLIFAIAPKFSTLNSQLSILYIIFAY